MLQRQPPEAEPLQLAEAKRHLRVDHDEEDELIVSLIAAARERAEAVTRRTIAPSSYTLHLRRPRPVIELPRPPVISLEGLEYDTADGEVVNWEPVSMRLEKASAPAVLYIYGPLPDDAASEPGSFRVRYRAGYTDTTLPRSIAQAMLLMVGHWYAIREPVALGTIAQVPMSVSSLLAAHRVALYR